MVAGELEKAGTAEREVEAKKKVLISLPLRFFQFGNEAPNIKAN